MLADKIIALLAQQPGVFKTFLRYRLQEFDKAAIDACLERLCCDGIVERRRHARYWLAGKQANPRTSVIMRAPVLATDLRYAPSTFISPLPKERLMARR